MNPRPSPCSMPSSPRASRPSIPPTCTSRWVPGNDSESERIIGRWLKARKCRDRVHVLTKVGGEMGPGKAGLSARWIEQAVEDSLKRLQTDYIDLYQSHWPDPKVTHDETLAAYQRLIKAGKVRHIGASNYDEALLSAALDTSRALELPRYRDAAERIQPLHPQQVRRPGPGPGRQGRAGRNSVLLARVRVPHGQVTASTPTCRRARAARA